MKIGDFLRLDSINGDDDFYGHYVGDVGKIIDIIDIMDAPIVVVEGRESSVLWLAVKYTNITRKMKIDALINLHNL